MTHFLSQMELLAVQQAIVSSTTPSSTAGGAHAKTGLLISLLRPAAIQQLIQARLNSVGEGNIPIHLVLPQGTVIQHNGPLTSLLQAVVITPTATRPNPQGTCDTSMPGVQ